MPIELRRTLFFNKWSIDHLSICRSISQLSACAALPVLEEVRFWSPGHVRGQQLDTMAGQQPLVWAEVMVKKKDSIRISQENIVHYCNVLLKISQKVRNWLRIAKNLMTAKIQPLTAEIQQLTAKIKELTAKIQQLTPKGQTADNQNLAADCHKN